MGRQAQIMPTLDSTMVHIEEAIWSCELVRIGLMMGQILVDVHVESGLVEDKFKVVMRRILVMTTLCLVSSIDNSVVESRTYKPPNANTMNKATLLKVGSFKDQIIGMGRIKMIKSVAIEKPALAYQFCVMSIQVPGMVLLYAFGTGVHWKIAAAVEAIP
jgi:hypothetical protein